MDTYSMILKIKKNWKIILVIISVSLFLHITYMSTTVFPRLGERQMLHQEIVSGLAPAPYQYRVLVPYTLEALIKPLSLLMPYRTAFKIIYVVYNFLSIFSFLFVLYLFLRQFFTKALSLIGVLFVSSTMSIVLKNHYFQPWSFIESFFFSLSLLLIYKRKYTILTVIIILASLNRATGIFIPLMYLLTSDIVIRINSKLKINYKPLITFGLYVLCWFLIFFGLRYFLPYAETTQSIHGTWLENINSENISKTFTNVFLFFSIFWIFSILGLKNAPKFIKKVSIIFPLYLIPITIFGVWYEVRLLMPLYAILAALALSYFKDNNQDF